MVQCKVYIWLVSLGFQPFQPYTAYGLQHRGGVLSMQFHVKVALQTFSPLALSRETRKCGVKTPATVGRRCRGFKVQDFQGQGVHKGIFCRCTCLEVDTSSSMILAIFPPCPFQVPSKLQEERVQGNTEQGITKQKKAICF